MLQVKQLQGGQEVAVATPGRLIDLVASEACDFARVTLVVVDEVDRCFDLGFEPQARLESIRYESYSVVTDLATAEECGAGRSHINEVDRCVDLDVEPQARSMWFAHHEFGAGKASGNYWEVLW